MWLWDEFSADVETAGAITKEERAFLDQAFRAQSQERSRIWFRICGSVQSRGRHWHWGGWRSRGLLRRCNHSSIPAVRGNAGSCNHCRGAARFWPAAEVKPLTPVGQGSDRVGWPSRRFLPGSRLSGEEIFGPVLAVVAMASLDEAMNWIKARSSPLAIYLFTQNREAESRLLGFQPGRGDRGQRHGNPGSHRRASFRRGRGLRDRPLSRPRWVRDFFEPKVLCTRKSFLARTPGRPAVHGTDTNPDRPAAPVKCIRHFQKGTGCPSQAMNRPVSATVRSSSW